MVIRILTSSDIFMGLISSTFVSDLFELMRRILHFICIAPHCKSNVPLVEQRPIRNGPCMSFHICKALFLLSMTLSPNL